MRSGAAPPVYTGPGAMAFTRTPLGLNSAAQARVIDARAAFVAPYAAPPARPIWPAMLLTLMMLPLPLAAIPGANAATRKNAARTLLANRASNVATSRSGVAPNQENPALLTNTSISPTASTRRWRSAGSLRSAPTKRARPPAAAIDSTVSAPRVASRPWTMTSAPSRASCKATARPMPDVAPVTRAFWPWRLRGWVAGTVALRNLVVDKPLGAHNSVVSVMVPDHASVDPSGAHPPPEQAPDAASEGRFTSHLESEGGRDEQVVHCQPRYAICDRGA